MRFGDMDCDTGRPAHPGEYSLCDETYGWLLEALVKDGQARVQPDLRENIVAFYADPVRPKGMKQKLWKRRMREIEAIKAGPNSTIAIEVRKQLLAPAFTLKSPKASGG